jgi:hypothetical protein
MRMLSLALLGTLALPAAAHAAPPAPAPDRTGMAVAALQNPVVQDALAHTVTQLAGIILDTRVGALAVLTDPAADIRPGDTLRDVATRNDPDVERHLYEKTRRSIATAGAVAGGVAGQVAEIDRTADRLQAALAPLLGMLGSGPADR